MNENGRLVSDIHINDVCVQLMQVLVGTELWKLPEHQLANSSCTFWVSHDDTHVVELNVDSVDTTGNEHNGPTRKRKPPVAVFVIGTSPMGELALCAARRLATRNVRVIAYVPSEHVPGVAEQLKLFALCGRYFKEWRDEGDNEVVYAHCSEPPDLVVEALDGCGKTVEGDTGITASVVDWLNAVNAPRVSFGQAAGVDPISGVLKKDFVRSTVCCQFGLPTMRRQLLNTCQVCVLDIGIPWAVLATAQPPERVGRPFPSPFFTRPFAFIRPT